MDSNSYAFTQTKPWTPVKVHDMDAVHPPPTYLLKERPALPSKVRSLNWDIPWALSTHVIPAAYIRTTSCRPTSVAPSVEPSTEQTKAERRKFNEDFAFRLADARENHHKREHFRGEERVFWNCLNRYAPKNERSDGITLLFAGANGFPKEIWEPTILSLLHSSSDCIAEIWTMESIQHGDSMLLNPSLSMYGAYDWTDNARDIANFLLYYMPTSPHATGSLPVHLEATNEYPRRLEHGFAERTLMIIGHSFGGVSSVLAALKYPHLFSSLVLIDPVMARPTDTKPLLNALSIGALNRRSVWNSREDALKAFSLSPFFSAWDPEILRLYVECGLYQPSPSSPEVFLKMPPLQEALVFADTSIPKVAWQEVSKLDPRIELRWILPGKEGEGGVPLGGPTAARERAWRRPENSSNVIIANAGHLIPHEAPHELAHELSTFIRRKAAQSKSKL